MYIFFFWPFRVIGFILTLYLLSFLAERFNIDLNQTGFLGTIALAFSIPLVALFWIDFPKYYFKIFPEKGYSKKIKKNSKKKLLIIFIKRVY